MKCKAIIIGIKGTKLTKKERIILSKEKPWGIILFKRNLKSIKQIKQLTSSIRALTNNNKFPILIDEEGKSVTRLKEIINNDISAQFFGNLVVLLSPILNTKPPFFVIRLIASM